MSTSLLDTPEYRAAQRFVKLTVEKRELRAQMDEIDAQLKTLQPALVGFLTASGLPGFMVKDYLLYPYREPWIYPITGVSRPMVCEALKISGLGKMVTENYSTQSLTKYVKELEASHKLISGLQPDTLETILPPALAHILHTKPAYSIRIQKKARAYSSAEEAFSAEFPAEPEFNQQETNDESE